MIYIHKITLVFVYCPLSISLPFFLYLNYSPIVVTTVLDVKSTIDAWRNRVATPKYKNSMITNKN